MKPKEPKKLKPAVTKLNIISLILIIFFLLTLFLRHERICALIYPAPLKQYREILGNGEKDFRGQKLGLGHIINFQYKENKKSLGELYSLTDIKFTPDNTTLTSWKGEDKIEIWNDNTAAVENMQRFRTLFTIPVPDSKKLEGRTVKGLLHLKLSYPVLIKFTEKQYITRSEVWNKQIAIHIFSKEELNKLSQLTNQMIKIWLICLGFFLLPVLLILRNQMGKQKKNHQPRVV